MQGSQAIGALVPYTITQTRLGPRQKASLPHHRQRVLSARTTTRRARSRQQQELDLLVACSSADRDPECEVVSEPAGTSSHQNPEEGGPASLTTSSPVSDSQRALQSLFSPTKLLAALPLLGLFGGAVDAGNAADIPCMMLLQQMSPAPAASRGCCPTAAFNTSAAHCGSL